MAEPAQVGVLISGRGSNMAALLYAARDPACPYAIALVAANDPAAPGLALAAAEGVPTFAHSHRGLPRAAFDAILDAELTQAGCTHVALAGYMRLLSPEFVARWAGRMVNIHPSLLPAYKGLDTHARALAAGEARAGCSVHVVTAELDDGPVLGRIEVAVLPGDTPDSLAARVLIAEHQLYPRALAAFVAGAVTPAALLNRVRAFAMAMPRAAEKLSHGTPAFHIEKGKVFAYFSHDHHGSGITGVLVKADGMEEQAMLIDTDPALYFCPAYLGPSGWIGLRLGPATDWEHVGARIARSWRHVAPARIAHLG